MDIELTASDRVALVGHAVSLLRNHAPGLADRYMPQDVGSELPELVRVYAPTNVVASVTEACDEAAKFLAREFMRR